MTPPTTGNALIKVEANKTLVAIQNAPKKAPSKTASLAKTIFGGIGNGLYSLGDNLTYYTAVQWVLKKIGYGGLVATQHTVFTTGALPNAKEEALRKLEEITGNEKFGLFLSSITPGITEAIRSKLNDKAKEYLKFSFVEDFINNRGRFLADLVTTLLAKVMVNIGQNIRQKRSNEGIDSPVTSVDIIAHLLETVSTSLNRVQAKLAEADAIQDSEKRKKALRSAIAPAIKEILGILLPQGSKEILLRLVVISDKAWSYLENKVLPEYLITFAGYMRGFESMSHVESWQKDPSNALLSRIANEMSTVVTQWGSELVADPQIASALTHQVMNGAVQATVSESVELIPWLNQQIISIGKSSNPSVKVFWNYLGGSVEALFANIAMRLSKVQKQDPLVKEEDEATIIILLNLLRLINRFVVDNNEKINNAYNQIRNGKEKLPEDDPDYINLFLPLAKDLQEMLALNGQLPGYLKEIVDAAFISQVPAFLAKHYKTWFPLLADGYDAMKEVLTSGADPRTNALKTLSRLPDSQDLVKICRGAGSRAKLEMMARIPAPVQIADTAAKEVAESAPVLKKELRMLAVQALSGPDTVVIPKDADPQLSKQVDDLKKWIGQWVSENAQAFVDTKDPRVVGLWNFIDHGVSEVAAHVILNHVQDGAPIHIVPSIIAEKLISLLGIFSEKFGEKIHKKYLEIVAKNERPETDAEFVALFIPLAEWVLQFIGMGKDEAGNDLTLPVPKLVDSAIRWLVREQGPRLFATYYSENLTPQQTLPAYQKRLKEILNIDEGMFKQVENIIDILSQKTASVLHARIHEQITRTIGHKSPNIVSFKLSDQDYLKAIVKSLFMQGLLHNFENLRADGEFSFAGILSRCGEALNKNATFEWVDAVYKASFISDSKERTIALRNVFQPLAHALVEQFRSPNAAKKAGFPIDLPFASLLESNDIWEMLRNEVVPDYLAEMYIENTKWNRMIGGNALEIKKRMESNYLPEACRVFAHWLSEFLPPFLYMGRSDLTQIIHDVIERILKNSGNPQGLSVAEYLKQNEMQIKQIITEEIFGLLKKGSSLLPPLQQGTKNYVESILFFACNRLTKRVDEIENPKSDKYQRDFLLNTGIRLLNTIKDHFQTLNATAKGLKKSTLHQLSYEEAVKGLQKQKRLHPGMPSKSFATRQLIKDTAEKLRKERKLLKQLMHNDELANCNKRLDAANDDLSKADKSDPNIKELREEVKTAHANRIKVLRLIARNKKKIERCKSTIKTANAIIKDAKKAEGIERAAFFKPFTTEILNLIGIKSPDDLPFHPQPLREQLWDNVNELLSSIFSTMFETVMEPSMRNTMLITALESLNSTLDTLDAEDEMLVKRREAVEAVSNLESLLNATEKMQRGSSDQRAQKIQIDVTYDVLEKAVNAIEKWERHAQNKEIKNCFLQAREGLSLLKTSLETVFLTAAKGPKPLRDNIETTEVQNKLKQAFVNGRKGLAALKESLTEIPKLIEAEEIEMETDETQIALNKACGELVLELTQIVDKSIIKTAFKFERVQTMTAEMVGRALRRQLGKKWTFLQIIDKAAASGIPNLYKGSTWCKDKEGNVIFARSGLTGDAEFPETEEEVEKIELEKIERGEKTQEEVRKQMVATARRLIVDNIYAYLKTPFLWFKKLWNALVNKIFGKYASNVREFFSWLGDLAFLKYIQMALAFILKPVINALWYFPERYLGSKTDHLLKSLQHDIHDNLLYQLSEELLASLKGNLTDMKAVLSPLLAAAETRDDLERSEVAAYRKKWLG